MPHADANSIIAQKSAFLKQQARLLSTPLRPSASWQDSAPLTTTTASYAQADDDSIPPTSITPLPQKQIDAALTKLNAQITQHNRLIFSAQAQRHVAEQIDTLYWNHVREEVEGGDLDDDDDLSNDVGRRRTVVLRSTDLQATSAVDQLPPSLDEVLVSPWLDPRHDDDGDEEMSEQAKEQYASLVTRLQSASATRDAAGAELQSYRRLREMLAPFEQAGESVQGNLVTKDGELGRELERMRALLGRVEGLRRVGGQEWDVVDQDGGEMAIYEPASADDLDERNRRKVRDVLDVR